MRKFNIEDLGSSGKLTIISILDIELGGGETNCGMTFVQPNEANVNYDIFENFRAISLNDLTLFLKLRADELCDNGEGLFMMLGRGDLGCDESENKKRTSFIRGPNGSVYKEAFENAAKDPNYSEIATEIERVHRATFIPYFLRSESDVMESFEHVTDLLELRQLEWKDCNINCGSPEALIDLIWSIHGNALKKYIKMEVQHDEEFIPQLSSSISGTESLYNKIVEALKFHMGLIAKRDFPDGQTTATYMYMVVKRKPRQ